MESTVSSAQETAGCSDYFVLVCGIPAVTIETGTGDCPLAIDQWATIWSQNTQVLPAIAQMFSSLTPAAESAASSLERYFICLFFGYFVQRGRNKIGGWIY